jgi:hypothetical protein
MNNPIKFGSRKGMSILHHNLLVKDKRYGPLAIVSSAASSYLSGCMRGNPPVRRSLSTTSDSRIPSKISNAVGDKTAGRTYPSSLSTKNGEDDISSKPPLTFGDLVSRYGTFVVASYATVWATTGLGCYALIGTLGPDYIISSIRQYGGDFEFLKYYDPSLGNIAMALLVNEMLEPIRLPIFLAFLRPICRRYDAWRMARGYDLNSKTDAAKKPSLMDSVRTYGAFGFMFYSTVWASTGVGLYLSLTAFGPDFALDAIKYIGIDKYIDLTRLDANVGNIALAIVLNELIEPIRLPVVIACLGPARRSFDKYLQRRMLNQK